MSDLPKYTDLMKPTLLALNELGGSASLEEIETAVVGSLGLQQHQLDAVYEKTGVPIVADRLSWARSYMKYAEFVDNPNRGVWTLTAKGREALGWTAENIQSHVAQRARAIQAANAAKKASQENDEGEQPDEENLSNWNDLLLAKLREISPDAFERRASVSCVRAGLPESRSAGNRAMVGSTGWGCCASIWSRFMFSSNVSGGRVR